MNKTIGFIGSGNMGSAMIAGIRKAELVSGNELMASAKTAERLNSLKESYEIRTSFDNKEVAAFADILFLCASVSNLKRQPFVKRLL